MKTTKSLSVIGESFAQLKDKAPSPLTLTRSLNERWLSDTLGWLLDRRGSHGFGTRFAEAFVTRIGERRTRGDGTTQYTRRRTFLKSGRSGEGVGATGFHFANASVIREFYLTKAVRRERRGPRYCDLVFFDLDLEDDFFLVIENKPFSTLRVSQLQCYQRVVEQRYARVAIRECVYLTLSDGDAWKTPPGFGDWVRLSWSGDILELLERCQNPGTQPTSAVASLTKLLRWIACVTDVSLFPEEARLALRDQLVRAAAECLHEELGRLHESGGGGWSLKCPSGRPASIQYITHHESALTVRLLPGFSVVVYGRRHGRQTFDKIIVPFGAHPDQVFNLLDLAAGEVYRQHFRKAGTHRGGFRRRPVTRGPARAQHEALFRLIHRHRHALRLLLQVGQPIVSRETEEGEGPERAEVT